MQCSNLRTRWHPTQRAYRPFASLLRPHRRLRDVAYSRSSVMQSLGGPPLPCGVPVRLLPRYPPRLQTAGNLRGRAVPSAASSSVIHEFQVPTEFLPPAECSPRSLKVPLRFSSLVAAPGNWQWQHLRCSCHTTYPIAVATRHDDLLCLKKRLQLI